MKRRDKKCCLQFNCYLGLFCAQTQTHNKNYAIIATVSQPSAAQHCYYCAGNFSFKFHLASNHLNKQTSSSHSSLVARRTRKRSLKLAWRRNTHAAAVASFVKRVFYSLPAYTNLASDSTTTTKTLTIFVSLFICKNYASENRQKSAWLRKLRSFLLASLCKAAVAFLASR